MFGDAMPRDFLLSRSLSLSLSFLFSLCFFGWDSCVFIHSFPCVYGVPMRATKLAGRVFLSLKGKPVPKGNKTINPQAQPWPNEGMNERTNEREKAGQKERKKEKKEKVTESFGAFKFLTGSCSRAKTKRVGVSSLSCLPLARSGSGDSLGFIIDPRLL